MNVIFGHLSCWDCGVYGKDSSPRMFQLGCVRRFGHGAFRATLKLPTRIIAEQQNVESKIYVQYKELTSHVKETHNKIVNGN
jgi:hypothetical protein